MKSETLELFEKAKLAMEFAYSPYSEKKVGSALRLSTGEVYSGCNIENVSFGGTVCAERVAVWKALSEHKSARIAELVVITDEKIPWSPCGFCRQVITEFALPDLKVHLANLAGIQKSFHFQKELFPEAFTPKDF